MSGLCWINKALPRIMRFDEMKVTRSSMDSVWSWIVREMSNDAIGKGPIIDGGSLDSWDNASSPIPDRQVPHQNQQRWRLPSCLIVTMCLFATVSEKGWTYSGRVDCGDDEWAWWALPSHLPDDEDKWLMIQTQWKLKRIQLHKHLQEFNKQFLNS